MEPQTTLLTTCEVEASGWDIRGTFFVERTVLCWGNGKEEIQLRCPLDKSAVVFLRLLHASRDNPPIAYRVTRIEYPNPDGKSRVHLMPLRRRETHQEEFARWLESTLTA